MMLRIIRYLLIFNIVINTLHLHIMNSSFLIFMLFALTYTIINCISAFFSPHINKYKHLRANLQC